jgi:hypothetical protein
MPTPLQNRFVHIDFEVDVQEWSEWTIQAWICPEVIAFIPQVLRKMRNSTRTIVAADISDA